MGKTVSQGFVSSLADIVYAQAGNEDDGWLGNDLTETYSDHGDRFGNVCKVSYLWDLVSNVYSFTENRYCC